MLKIVTFVAFCVLMWFNPYENLFYFLFGKVEPIAY